MVISSEAHAVTAGHEHPRHSERERTIMDNAPAPSHRIPGPDTAVSARLGSIEERLDEIIRRLDELKTNLLTVLNHVQPNHQHTTED